VGRPSEAADCVTHFGHSGGHGHGRGGDDRLLGYITGGGRLTASDNDRQRDEACPDCGGIGQVVETVGDA
jgi:hypothetical protein